jgi:copper chaperone CopZ
MTCRICLAILLLFVPAALRAADKQPTGPQTFTHRVAGLFQPDRADELREAMKDHPRAKLDSVDYDKAQATFTYDPKQVSAESLSGSLGGKGFTILPPSTSPPDKLTPIEIGVVGLDCKGCALATYWAIYKIDGVERATVNYREGRVVAVIDPAKTNRAAIEEAMKKKLVTLKPALAAPAK